MKRFNQCQNGGRGMNKTKMLSSQHKAIKFSFLKLLINDKSSYDKVSILSMDLPKVSFPVYFQTIRLDSSSRCILT